ncbi:MAG: hypothetical protein JNK14_13970 [Chitinophagaceae bacterium]|nr:hypothetical protein [Chitinophagaceae bacterium]
MKPLTAVLFTGIPVLLISGMVSGQIVSIEDEARGAGIFSKGVNRIVMERNIDFTTFKTKFDGVNTGRSNSWQLHAEGSRFLIDGFAIGGDIDVNATGWRPVSNNDVLVRNWMVTPHALYGKSLSGTINIYGKAGVGFGSNKTINETPSGSTTNKANLFSYSLTAGLPFLAKKGSNTYLTPYVSYRHITYDYDDGKEKVNRLSAGIKLELYSPCSEMRCDRKNGYALTKSMYDQGSSYIGYYSRGMIAFGSSETEYDNFPDTDKENFTDGSLKLDYVYYIADNFGVGAGLNIKGEVQKSDDNNYKFTTTGLTFSPQFVVNMPVDNWARNFFLQGEGSFGSQKTVFDFGSASNEDKYGVAGFGAYIGYNTLFGKNTSFTYMVGYLSETIKDKDNDQKEQYNGLNFQAGLRFMIGKKF